MKKRFLTTLVCGALLLVNFQGAPPPPPPVEISISFSGAYSLYTLTQLWAAEYKKTHPNVRFDIQSGGAGKGLTDCLSGGVDVAMFSRELTQEERSKVWSLWLCKDAILPTISSKNPNVSSLRIRGVKKNEFLSMFVDRSIDTWEELLGTGSKTPHKINVYTRADACGAAGTWASYFGKAQENLRGTGIPSDPGLAEAVKKDVNSIGYNSYPFIYNLKTGKKYPGIEVIPIDVNGNGTIDADENFYDNLKLFTRAVNDGKYPSPPVRNLYFLTKGKTNRKEILDFFNWCLNDGQKLLVEAGFVPLPKKDLQNSLKKLNGR